MIQINGEWVELTPEPADKVRALASAGPHSLYIGFTRRAYVTDAIDFTIRVNKVRARYIGTVIRPATEKSAECEINAILDDMDAQGRLFYHLPSTAWDVVRLN